VDIENPDSVIKIELNPFGIYKENEGEFILELFFIAKEDNENGTIIMTVDSKAIFTFPNKCEFDKIPDYFYKNSIAIFFPYLRAFISTLTLQSNTPILILGLLNLSNLESVYRHQTKCIKD
jgi:preprotein translocase subunit SecB